MFTTANIAKFPHSGNFWKLRMKSLYLQPRLIQPRLQIIPVERIRQSALGKFDIETRLLTMEDM